MARRYGELDMEVYGDNLPYASREASRYSEAYYSVRFDDLDDDRALVLDAYTRLVQSRGKNDARTVRHLSNIRSYILDEHIYVASRYDRRRAYIDAQARKELT